VKQVITFDLSDVKKYGLDVRQKLIPAAASRAINKTLTNVRTEANKQIREERALSASTVRNALAIKRATKLLLIGELIASGRPIPLREYQARQTKAGVTVKVSPGGRKLVSHAGNKGFIVSKIGGHVFAREGKSRLPIKKLYGPSIPSTFIKAKVLAALDRVASSSWQKRIAEELRYELSKG
jgi:hypothetical protein